MESGIRFRQVRESDLKALNAIVNDADVARFLTLSPPVSMRKTREKYKSQKTKTWYAILVDGEIAGSFELQAKTPDVCAHSASFGICIARKHWGRGIGKKTIEYALGLAKRRGIRRVEFCAYKANRRACALYEKCGFKAEGVKHKALRKRGRYYDAVAYAILI
jgi:RimJ/RimL family protein N-acetyltransferase